MGTESFNPPPETGKSEEEIYAEEVALDELLAIRKDVQARLDANPQHDADGHWSAAVYKLSLARNGGEDVGNALEKQGWDKDFFPNN